MIADGSDVFFQRDPFELARRTPNAELIFFGDRGDSPPEGERYFRLRMDQCADAARRAVPLLNNIAAAFGGVYANGGIFLGSAAAVLSLCEEVERSAVACGYWESDHGLVNYARFRELERRGPGAVRPFPDMHHSISMGHYNWPMRNSRGEFLNHRTEEVLYIVHQYYTRAHHANLGLFYNKVRPWLTSALRYT